MKKVIAVFLSIAFMGCTTLSYAEVDEFGGQEEHHDIGVGAPSFVTPQEAYNPDNGQDNPGPGQGVDEAGPQAGPTVVADNGDVIGNTNNPETLPATIAYTPSAGYFSDINTTTISQSGVFGGVTLPYGEGSASSGPLEADNILNKEILAPLSDKDLLITGGITAGVALGIIAAPVVIPVIVGASITTASVIGPPLLSLGLVTGRVATGLLATGVAGQMGTGLYYTASGESFEESPQLIKSIDRISNVAGYAGTALATVGSLGLELNSLGAEKAAARAQARESAMSEMLSNLENEGVKVIVAPLRPGVGGRVITRGADDLIPRTPPSDMVLEYDGNFTNLVHEYKHARDALAGRNPGGPVSFARALFEIRAIGNQIKAAHLSETPILDAMKASLNLATELSGVTTAARLGGLAGNLPLPSQGAKDVASTVGNAVGVLGYMIGAVKAGYEIFGVKISITGS